MLRMGRNQKTEQPSDAEATADYSSQSSTTAPPPSYNAGAGYGTNAPAYGGGSGAGNALYGGGQASTTRAVTESESLARDIKEGNLSGFVGAGTSVSGEATFQMMLRVDGHLSGRVSSGDGTLIVSAGGIVDADVAVAIALINGTVNGDITATNRIELGRVAKVNGNIQTPALVVESGALFEGSCRMTQPREAQETPAPPEEEDTRSTGYGDTSPSSYSAASSDSSYSAASSDPPVIDSDDDADELANSADMSR